MGEQKKKKKNGGNESFGEKKEQQQKKKNNISNGEKKATSDEKSQLVLKMDLHCEGCTKKVIRYVKRLQGVEDVKADRFSNKVRVFGKVDPSKVQEKLESKTKRKVEIISAQPSLPNNNKKDKDTNQTDDLSKKSSKEEKTAKKKDEAGVVVFKTTRLHCKACTLKIQKSLSKIKGVELVSVDKEQDLVTVKGAMGVKELEAQLKKNKYIKKSFEIVPQKKESGGGNGNGKKDNGTSGGGDNKKEKGGGKKKEGAAKVEQESAKPEFQERMEYPGSGNAGYLMDYVYPPQLFSDENPNACFIM
ncbi:hypothetical protein ACHQM5_020608 [Ranunculus cassubicifolius]